MRLEKMVKLMEDHQDRAQAQRTRLENRIAQLELAQQRSKEQRYVRENSSSSTKCHVDSERDKLSQDYHTDTEQMFSQDSFNSQSSLHCNHTNSVAKRSGLSDTGPPQKDYRQLRNYGDNDYTQRQTSSDEDQPYICERCRQETYVRENKDPWFNKNDSTDNTNESFHNWLTNVSSLEITQTSFNSRDLQNDDYFYDSPWTDRNRNRNLSAMYKLHGGFDNVDDSSRESQNHYQRERIQYRHHHRVRSPFANRTVPHSFIL